MVCCILFLALFPPISCILNEGTARNNNSGKDHFCAVSTSNTEQLHGKFTGPRPCPQRNDAIGYTDIDTLNNDMFFTAQSLVSKSNCNESAQHLYHLCPETIFEMDDFAFPIIPTHDNLVIKCGVDGSSENSCILSGGETHIYFHEQITVKNVQFHGITMINGDGQSIRGYSSSDSSASFYDCHWIDNEGGVLIDVQHEDTDNGPGEQTKQDEPLFSILQKIIRTCPRHEMDTMQNDQQKYQAMKMNLEACTFMENSGVAAITISGGEVEIVRSKFSYNEGAVTIGVSFGGKLSIRETTFTSNSNYFSTIFIPSDSFYDFNFDDSIYDFGVEGKDNDGDVCDDIFWEFAESNCFNRADKENCFGWCCGFDDENCDNGKGGGSFVKRAGV